VIGERCAWVLGVAALWAAGYFALGWSADLGSARSLASAADDAIPFLPWTVWTYLLGIGVIALPAVAIDERALLRRTGASYAALILASFACFALWPVTSSALRPALPAQDESLALRALALLYRLDPPFNLFPSLHVSLSLASALALRRVSPALGRFGFAATAVVALSVCTVKQHFAWDVVGGAGFAGVCARLTSRAS
jgi:membrane-associated phospholipid phosphatase